MIPEELEEWADDFASFHARFAHLLRRREPRAQAAKYLRGLMALLRRKNGWQLAEAVGDKTPDATQRLLYQARWDADAARDVLQQFIIETFGDEEGVGVVDETGFLKKGDRSVGVKRQYSGTAGRIENCQVGTFLSYATSGGHVFLDRRLYLPKEWCDNRERRARAKAPQEILFQTKPEQAMVMLERVWQQGVPMRWVTGDEVYGDATKLRDGITAHHRLYVLAVRSHKPIWTERPQVEDSATRVAERVRLDATRAVGGRRPQMSPARGRPRTKARLADGERPATTVMATVAAWPESRWQRLTVGEGEKGPRIYDWARQRVVESRDGLPGPDAWLLARRSISDPLDVAHYLSNAPAHTPLLKLAQVAATRYTVEQCIEEAKGETGLDDYEVRHWHSWHRHITLSMMAHAWLASIRRKIQAEKRAVSHSWQN